MKTDFPTLQKMQGVHTTEPRQPEKCFGHFNSPDLPMEFICMDLVGPIHPPSSRGNKYVLTVIDMLTGFTIAVPIKNKNAETICEAYRDNV